jgi:glycosyltransferase involved in cell wall biosynthesis
MHLPKTMISEILHIGDPDVVLRSHSHICYNFLIFRIAHMPKIFREVGMNEENLSVSIVVPVYNEIQILPELLNRLNILFKNWPREHEIIFIDDGSTDGSSEFLDELPLKDPAIRIVRFLRNFGQQAAVTAGFEYVQKDVAIVMDSDLQIDPGDVPKLIKKMEEGYDVVGGFRENRAEGALRKFVSWSANRFFGWYFKLPYRDIGCGLQAFRKRFLEGPARFTKMYGHAAIFSVWRGGKFADVPVANNPRYSGKTKYGWINLIQFFLDILITFNINPIQLTILFLTGSSLVGLGLIAGLGSIFGLLFLELKGVTVLAIVALFLIVTGTQLMSLGILNERISRIDNQIQKTPMFVVDKVIENTRSSSINETKY